VFRFLQKGGEILASISGGLKATLAGIRDLDSADFAALTSWLQGNGRAQLRDRGATDQDIGGARPGIDKAGDAPVG
jgi:hypothetical protein